MTDEFEIIRRWFTRRRSDAGVRVGIGDDAAIVVPSGPIAIAVDTLVSGTHFPADFDARSIGHRALAVNLSDMAAVSARPRWATLSLTLPAVDDGWLDAFAAGLFELADRFDVSLIGGDTTRGPLSVTVSVTGDAARQTPLRSRGRPGDRIFVSGTLGDSAAALEYLGGPDSEWTGDVQWLIDRFRFPEPRVALGLALDGIAHASIDVSDGLLADLGHICEQSGCGARLDLDSLPISAALGQKFTRERAESFALRGGDDYELCFTLDSGEGDRVRNAAADAGVSVADIGELTAGGGIRGYRDGREIPLAPSGFRHF